MWGKRKTAKVRIMSQKAGEKVEIMLQRQG